MRVTIANIETLAPAIKRLTLAANTETLPAASPGAHVILTIPGPTRNWKNAYSLVSVSPGHYEIIVRRVEHSRGGSAWLHGRAEAGQQLEISPPANLFPIARLAARHLLLSAGIGITPFLAYLPMLQSQGREFELHHVCKAEEAAAFRALLPAGAPNITIHTSRNVLNIPSLLAAQKLGTHVYICGPASFMEAATAAALQCGWPPAKIHAESFGATAGGAPFTVRLASSGRTLTVGPEESLLEALEAAGLAAPYLCRGGACGECELPVLAGIPEHRDHVLSPARRAANNAILTCISRAATPELVLDF